MEKLKFSVSMCVYGGDDPDNFRQALESVYDQTCPPDEVVLVVDGPVSEEINDIVSFYEKEKSLIAVRLPENVGHGNARRTGFERCSHNYIAIADADDINARTRFERQIQCFEKDIELSVVGSGVYHFVGNINNIASIKKFPITDIGIKKLLKRRCPVAQPSVMLKKQEVEKAGGYLDWYHAEDYYLWIRMYLSGAKFYNLKDYCVYMRKSKDQMKRRGGFRYFRSMCKLFRFMRMNKIIGWPLYFFNVISRFIVQILMPNKLRSYIRKKM
ncbi:MAG: glycosyltransferase [Oscillospiraceae bacterium]|nr:glycosyltransferase [Oscillospiraceae bacterium]MDD4413162.1 glycosyltransferase [Oscillospiraceae bacterium]